MNLYCDFCLYNFTFGKYYFTFDRFVLHFCMGNKQYTLLNRYGEAIGHLHITVFEEPGYKIGILKDMNNKLHMLAFTGMCPDESIAFALMDKIGNKEQLSILPVLYKNKASGTP